MTRTAGTFPPGRLRDVSAFLDPQSIAVVGASDREHSLGGAAVGFLRKFNYPGEVWPVHPKGGSVAGYRAYTGAEDLPGAPDLVVFAINAGLVPAAVSQYAARGARSGVVWAGGFAEGGPEGADLQRELVDACEESGMAVLGPNCIGLISTEQPVIASFASFLREVDTLPVGHISMIGQSGGLVTMAVAKAQERGFGFRYAVSTGNEAVLTTADFIAAFADDASTRVIAAYMEGVQDGPRLVEALGAARRAGKPVAVLRGGTSKASARAAAAHTGALAGEARVWQAVFEEFGVIEAVSLEELIDLVTQIASTPALVRPNGPGVGLVTFGGGGGVLAADQCERHGLSVPPLSEATVRRLRPLVPPIASVANPVDLTPQVYSDPKWMATLPQALDAVAGDAAVDSVLLQFGPMAAGAAEIASEAQAFMARARVPVVLAWPLAPKEAADWLARHAVNVFDEYDRAIRVIAALASASQDPQTETLVPSAQIDWSSVCPAPAPGTVLAEHAAYRLLEAAGLPVAANQLAGSAKGVARAGDLVGWPVAIKGMSSAITHKFAAGLVALNLADADGATDAAIGIEQRAQQLGVDLDGLLVQQMVDGACEILVSALRDPNFGVVVSCAAGGVMTELIDDVVLRRAPFGPKAAAASLARLRAVQFALSKRSWPLAPLASFVSRFSQMAADVPWESFVIEINPVAWTGSEARAVDGLILIEQP
ncbi:MAG: acetate--CoA ligase family protein [Bifidobacteriaceae bacterium]|nr:acetate--CoA ligase family protein [Bifidobacteriaceae bacterium]